MIMRGKKTRLLAFGLALSVVLAGSAAGDITTGLAGYWPLDGNGEDVSGNGLHGAVEGAVTPTADRFAYADSAMSFSGAADARIVLGDLPQLRLTGEMTLAAWVSLSSANANNGRIIAKSGGSGRRCWSLNVERSSGGVIHPATFQVAVSGSTNLSVRDTQPLPTEQWVHMAGVYRPGQAMEIYVNGELRNTLTAGVPANQFSDNGLAAFIGNRNEAGDCGWMGLIDEARVYSRALSAADVKELFAFKPAPRVKAYNPEPADGSEGIATPLFTWKSGVTAVLHNVYMGTSPELGEADLAGPPLSATTYWHIPGLEPGVRYWWRVDEIEADLTTVHTGDVWTFAAAPLTAYRPQPYDGARWVDPNDDLSWTAGLNAAMHEVYFGTDPTSVAEGAAGTFKGRQGATTFDPGPLQADVKHYWRVDEIDASANVRKGPVWSFTTLGPGGGIRGDYFASIDLSGDPAVTRTESQIDFTWPDGTTPGTNSPAAGVPTDGFSCRWTGELQVDRADAYRLVTRSDDGVRVFLDGVKVINNWTDHGAMDNLSEPLDLIPGRIYSLVMEMYENTGSAVARLSWESPSLARRVLTHGPLQLPLHAGLPFPGNGAVDVLQSPILSWRAGDEATEHDVYFGTDANAVAEATTASSAVYRGRKALDTTTFDPGTLEWGRKFFWRVDEVGASDTWKGSVWAFTTADFLIVDDFESYTDEEGTDSRIYETWIDGYADGSSGSTVGHLDPPFAEQTIVHSGNQSMPFDYNNVNSPFYSEAVRTWSAAQDWTVNEVNTLTLHIRGAAGNAAERLYVVLEDSNGHAAEVACPDATIVTTAQWTEWRIGLSEFTGVNASRIKRMYVGAGNRTNPVKGGAGHLYLDDIRVTRTGP
jgi:hypothetical protein